MSNKYLAKVAAAFLLAGTLLAPINGLASDRMTGHKKDSALVRKLDLPSEKYIQRFKHYRGLFELYSGDPPKNFTQDQFEALLVAVSINECSMHDSVAFMGYDSGKSHKGVIRQLEAASDTLRSALNGTNPKYPSTKLGDVLAVYNRGSNKHPKGVAYAKRVTEDFGEWSNYFSMREKGSGGENY